MNEQNDICISAFDVSSLFGEIFLVMTPEGELLRWNDQLTKTSGYTDSEIASKQWSDLVPVEQHGRVRELLRDVRTDGAARGPVVLLTADGEAIPHEFRGRSRQEEGRRLIYGYVYRAEESADEPTGGPMPADLQKALSRLPVYVFAQDRELRYTSMSRPLPGRAMQDILGRTHEDLFPEDQARRLDELKERLLSTGESERVTTAVWSEGKRHYFDTYLAPRYDQEGNLQGLVGASVDVTERKKTEDQFRSLVDEIEEYAIFMLDLEGHITTWNQGAQKIKGYEEDEILGRHFSVFYTEEDRAKDLPEEVLEAAAREGHIEMEGWRVRKDGSRFWARVTVNALFDEEDHLRGYSKVTRDMTERRGQEKRLRESEERYRRLFEEAQEGITITSPEGVIVDANPAVCAFNGYSRKELIGMQTTELYVYPEERSKAHRLLEEEGAFRNLEIHVRRRDGQVITCQVSASAIRDVDGNIEAFQSYARDVTEQKQARRALEESERKFRELAEQSIMGIALVQDEIYRYVNPRLAEMLGYSPDELINRKGPKELVHPGDWPRVKQSIEACLSGKQPAMQYRARGLRKDGEAAEFEVHGTRIHSGGRPAVLVYLIDITDQRQLQRDILRIQEEERQRMGQDLHDGVASQLTGVKMLLSSTIKDAADQCPPVAGELERIKNLISESGEDVRRISRGLSPVNLAEGDLPTALERLAQTTNAAEDVSCDVEIEEELPDKMEGIATHLYWIAQEAVTNAHKYASAEAIHIKLCRQSMHLILLVTDDGKGFELSDVGDEGLGQRTMRYRTELIGGTLSVESRPGEGTTVRVDVPIG